MGSGNESVLKRKWLYLLSVIILTVLRECRFDTVLVVLVEPHARGWNKIILKSFHPNHSVIFRHLWKH